MASIDPVANLLTKIRNASRSRHPSVEVPASRFTEQILSILKQEGFIRTYKPVGQAPKQQLRVYLKYAPDHTPAIAHLVTVSKSGYRRYCNVQKLPRVLGGLGKAILTTSKGVMTDQEARRQRVGGEILCHIW